MDRVRDLLQATDLDWVNVVPKLIQSPQNPEKKKQTSDAAGLWAANNVKEGFMLYPALQRATSVSRAWVAAWDRTWQDGARCQHSAQQKISQNPEHRH